MWVCKNCGNDNPLFIGERNGNPYCRKCLEMQGEEVSYRLREDVEGEYFLSYSLTEEQQIIAKQLMDNYLHHENSLVHAVCGAGKTEMVYPLISLVLKEGKRVAIAIPRKDVVIELLPRVQQAFKKNKVIAVYGGHHEEKEGDIVILTMHQIYRYQHYFDLVVADEIDAFPFANERMLRHFFLRSSRGPIVLMSATPSDEWEDIVPKKNHLLLSKRFHGYPIPVPKIMLQKEIQKKRFLIHKLRQYEKEKKPCLIFVSSREKAEQLYALLSLFIMKGAFVHSLFEKRNQYVEAFKKGKLLYLVTTSILERGITIAHLQVIIYDAESSIYQEKVLEQISGRVGRKKEDPYGEIYFLAEEVTSAMKKTITSIEKYNDSL